MLTYQIWSLLPGYWTNTTELTQSFKVEYLVVGAHLPALWSLLSRLLHQPHWPCRELQGRVVAGAHLSDLVPPPWLLHQPHWPYPESFKVQYYRCCWYRTVLPFYGQIRIWWKQGLKPCPGCPCFPFFHLVNKFFVCYSYSADEICGFYSNDYQTKKILTQFEDTCLSFQQF